MKKCLLVSLFVVLSVVSAAAQNTSKKKNARPAVSPTPIGSESPKPGKPVYFYDFEKPEFLTSRVHIEHDENGVGLITFEKKKLEESFTRTLVLSVVTTELLRNYWDSLDFVYSNVNYQSKLEYPHLGSMRLKMINGRKERTAEFNWTDNPEAKALTDEYKKIGYEHVWMFELEVARKNQPLESPRIMKAIDSYLKRGEISDPPHMVPFLMELSGDERMPLIARNHAKRLAESITKEQN